MKRFEELDKRKTSEVEKTIREKWEKMDILNKTIQNRNGKENFVFYDGPIYANGLPVIRYTKSIFSNFLLNQGITG